MPLWSYIDGGPEFAFVASAFNGASWSTSLGTAAANRTIIVCVASGGATPPTGVTVDGVAAVMQVNNTAARIWTANATANTSGTTTLTGGSSPTLQGIGVYAAYGLVTAVPNATATGVSTASIAAGADGFVIGCAERNGGTISGWSGLTTNYTADFGGSGYSSASASTTLSQTILATATGAGSVALAAWS